MDRNLKKDSTLKNDMERWMKEKNLLVRRVGTVPSSFFVREGKDKDHGSFSTDVYPLKNSAILDSATTIHIFNEITRFLDLKSPTLVITCGQAKRRFRLKDMELSTLSSKD